MKEEQYEKAIHYFEEALQLDPNGKDFIHLYAIALYEIKNFKKAKKYTEIALDEALHEDNQFYFPMFELHMTILIQLEEYDEVEEMISNALSKNIIPANLVKKFIYLKELNERLAVRYRDTETFARKSAFSIEKFLQESIPVQHQQLTALKGFTLHQSIPTLREIVAHKDIPPSTKTFALILLKEVGHDEPVQVEKYGMKMTCIPQQLLLPNKDERNRIIIEQVANKLEKNPSKYAIVKGVLEKFLLTIYPFGWGDYSIDEIVEALLAYVDCLMNEKTIPSNDLIELIRQVDRERDF